MRAECIRHGQIEVGIVEHEGQEFSALGASVIGTTITGYTGLDDGRITLTTWCGQTMLASRSEIVERFWDDSLAVMFCLRKGRFIVGYALGENGMLFRGELLTDCDENEARRIARHLSGRFAELDTEDDDEVQ